MNTKRTIHLAISAIFHIACQARERLLRAVGVRPSVPSVIIYYHVVTPGQRQRFADQLDILLRHAMPIRAGHTSALDQTVRHVAVTFDDASQTVLSTALPELERRSIPFSVFAITGMLGQPVSWEPSPERLMTAEELRTISENSLVEIGSHTVSHPLLPDISEAAAHAELRESKTRLEQLLHKEVSLFCFPYGISNDQLVDCCRRVGYKRVFTGLPKGAFSDPKEFVCGRVRVDPTDRRAEFYLKIMGAYRWLPTAIALKQRLRGIFVGYRPTLLRSGMSRKSESRTVQVP